MTGEKLLISTQWSWIVGLDSVIVPCNGMTGLPRDLSILSYFMQPRVRSFADVFLGKQVNGSFE